VEPDQLDATPHLYHPTNPNLRRRPGALITPDGTLERANCNASSRRGRGRRRCRSCAHCWSAGWSSRWPAPSASAMIEDRSGSCPITSPER
jgi:hypothetical protein